MTYMPITCMNSKDTLLWRQLLKQRDTILNQIEGEEVHRLLPSVHSSSQ